MTTATAPTFTDLTVRILTEADQDPDLSWLDQTDAEMGNGFEATANERKATHGAAWEMVGIYAVAEFSLNGTLQTMRSAGLWGIESDSGATYLAEVGAQEWQYLRNDLASIGIPAEMLDAAQPASN